MSKWISVKDELPENNCRVICACWDYVTKAYWVEVLWYTNNHWVDGITKYGNDYTLHVTHWMPITEPLKEDSMHSTVLEAAKAKRMEEEA